MNAASWILLTTAASWPHHCHQQLEAASAQGTEQTYYACALLLALKHNPGSNTTTRG